MNIEEAIKNGTVKAGEVRPDFEVLPVNIVRLLLSLREQELETKVGERARKMYQQGYAEGEYEGLEKFKQEIWEAIKKLETFGTDDYTITNDATAGKIEVVVKLSDIQSLLNNDVVGL